jgi:hypothetical protein
MVEGHAVEDPPRARAVPEHAQELADPALAVPEHAQELAEHAKDVADPAVEVAALAVEARDLVSATFLYAPLPLTVTVSLSLFSPYRASSLRGRAEAARTARTAAVAPLERGFRSMSRVPNPPPDDIFKLSLVSLKSFLVDLPPGARIGMRQEQEGWPAVAHEITSNQPTYGDRAGITATDFNKFVVLNDQYDQILAQLPQVQKAVEVLVESLAHVDNQRHRIATQIADSAEAHANAEGRDPTLRTAYEKTIAYRAVIADKAAKTRKKNEEAKKAAGGGATGVTGTTETTEPTGTTETTEPTEPTAKARSRSKVPNAPPKCKKNEDGQLGGEGGRAGRSRASSRAPGRWGITAVAGPA